jgi:hypothetical protein
VAVRVTLPPVQKLVGPFGVMVTMGRGFTVTFVVAEVALQPPALVTVTLKLPELLVVIDCVAAPLDQA